MLMIILTSCRNEDSGPVTGEDFRKGGKGVVVSFNKDSTPKSIGEDSKFSIVVTAHNKGGYESDGVVTLITEEKYICLRGDDGKCFEKSDNNKYNDLKTKSFVLNGRSTGNPKGEYKSMSFDVKSNFLDPQRTKHSSEVLLTSCYKYTTVATDDICIDPKASDPEGERICRIRDIEQDNQGSPIAIKKIETVMIDSGDETVQPEFMIYVEDIGKGAVVDRDKTDDACTGSVRINDWDVVHVLEIGVGTKYRYEPGDENSLIECPEKFTLTDGKGRFRCRIKDKIKKQVPAYVTQISVKIGFGYTESESMTIDIEKK